MDALALARYLSDVIGDSARAALGWEVPEDPGDDLGPFQPVIAAILDTLSADAADLADLDEVAVRAIGRWKVWEAVADATALDYDESQGDRTTSLSQMTANASKRANRAYFDALPYLPGYRIQRRTAIQRPRRFGGRNA